jgi:hypothetical protein
VGYLLAYKKRLSKQLKGVVLIKAVKGGAISTIAKLNVVENTCRH